MASLAFAALRAPAPPALTPQRVGLPTASAEPAPRSTATGTASTAIAAAGAAVAVVVARRRGQQQGLVGRRVGRAERRRGRGRLAISGLRAAAEEVLDTVIVGTGVSGLCTGFALKKAGPNTKVLVTEARDRVGGNITTKQADGRLWEEGPNSFQPGDPILATACDVGLQEDILLADPGSYRYVWWDGALRPLPAGPADAVFGDFLSFPGKIRAGLGAIGIKDPMPDREESVKEFVTRNLGEEAFERLIDPFVSGVYAGDPATLSAEAAVGRVQGLEKAGSLVAGAIELFQERARQREEGPPRDPRLPEVKGQTVGSFRGGLQQFANALTENLTKGGTPVNLNWKLSSMSWDKEAKVHVLEYETPDGPKRVRSRSVVLTAPAYVAATLLKPTSAEAAATLEEIRYPCVGAVTVEYPLSAFRDPEHGKGPVNGFGQLHPRSQGIRTLGTIYSSSLFPGRVPDPSRVMLLHYIGGAQDPRRYGGIDKLSEGELVEATHKDTITTLLKPSAASELPRVLGVRVWPKAIPQFELGHLKRVEKARKALEAEGVEGLYLCGNYTAGVALGRCVEYGLEVGAEVAEFVKPQH